MSDDAEPREAIGAAKKRNLSNNRRCARHLRQGSPAMRHGRALELRSDAPAAGRSAGMGSSPGDGGQDQLRKFARVVAIALG